MIVVVIERGDKTLWGVFTSEPEMKVQMVKHFPPGATFKSTSVPRFNKLYSTEKVVTNE